MAMQFGQKNRHARVCNRPEYLCRTLRSAFGGADRHIYVGDSVIGVKVVDATFALDIDALRCG